MIFSRDIRFLCKVTCLSFRFAGDTLCLTRQQGFVGFLFVLPCCCRPPFGGWLWVFLSPRTAPLPLADDACHDGPSVPGRRRPATDINTQDLKVHGIHAFFTGKRKGTPCSRK
jgi:hypothetical protein